MNAPLSQADFQLSSFQSESISDRRADVVAKQEKVAALLREAGRDAILLMSPENFSWLTSGATPRGVLDPSAAPVLFANHDSRWVVTDNVGTQRLFDEELEGLGFQLKEWPWHWGRRQLLADLVPGRKMAVDVAPEGVSGDFVHVGERLGKLRRVLSEYEQACLQVLGQLVAHALEATCRTLNQKDTEREVAGQLTHRLIHRGALPVHVGVAADGRSSLYRRQGFTSTPIEQFAVLTAVARKYGLCASASRMVCFGEPPDELKREINAVVRVSAGYLASTWPDAVPREVLTAGRRVYLLSGFEHEWLLAPQGHLTARAPVELLFTPDTADLLEAGMAVTWSATAGAAVSCDTYLVTDRGPKAATPAENWPVKRIRTQGTESVRPDILVR